ncbi:hypothetical protein YTPLAS72_29890 [Nitrospira sp.]|nr:hypothetical protein YTPLAS72_29890 [Nitrospira sp.]
MRDAIAQPTPGPNLTKTEPGKEAELFNTNFEEVESVVDNSAALVRKIEKMIRGNELRLYWLHNRSSDGTFPDIVFE